jgi:hypothetical protein
MSTNDYYSNGHLCLCQDFSLLVHTVAGIVAEIIHCFNISVLHLRLHGLLRSLPRLTHEPITLHTNFHRSQCSS